MPDPVVDPNLENSANPAPAPAAEPAAAAPTRPEGLADEFWDDASGVKVDAVLGRLNELTAAEQARSAEVPDSAEDYVFELPAELAQQAEKAGLEFKADDPRVKAVAGVLHKLGAKKDAAGELLTAYAQAEIEVASQMANTIGEEVRASFARLGEKAEARMNAVHAAVKQHAGQHAEALLQELTTGDAYVALEAILAKATGVPIDPNVNPKSDPYEGLTGAALIQAVRENQAKAAG